MKKAFEMPKIVVEQFVPNEYVAACGESGTTYLFTCDAGGGNSGDVYLETNGVEGLQTTAGGHFEGLRWVWDYDADSYLSSYHACGITHEAENDTGAFLNGYYVEGRNVTPVIVWRGPNKDNTHCTTNLDINSWTTAKS